MPPLNGSRSPIRLGAPLIDCRPVRDIIAFANLPKVTLDGTVDPKPWTASSRIPLLTYLDPAERLGARIVTIRALVARPNPTFQINPNRKEASHGPFPHVQIRRIRSYHQ